MSRTILVVDDDAAIRELVAEYLSTQFVPLIADSGPAALLLIEQHPEIALVISDVAMPRMTGIQLATAARQMRPELPFLMISGTWSEQQMPMGYPFLEKPFRLSVMLTMIERLLVPEA